MTAPSSPQGRPEVPASRLLLTLGSAGALAGLAIVVVFRGTQPTIQRYKAEQLRLAVQEVLQEPERFDTLYVVDGALTTERPAAGADTYEQLFAGYRGTERVGYAIVTGEPGFQDVIRIIFGYDAETGAVVGMRVLESKETPGLGDKIEKDMSFVAQFNGALAPLLGVNRRLATDDPHEIDLITGATISSRALIRAINAALERMDSLIVAYEGGAT